MKRRAIQFGCLFLALFVVALILFPFFMTHHDNLKHGCHGNLMQISLAMMMYSEDYDEKLPPVLFSGKTIGWANGLQPYIKSYAVFQCPDERNPGQVNPTMSRFTDYWINSNVASANLTHLDYPSHNILVGDGDGGSPQSTASYAINQLPASWRQLEISPAKRHVGGANYAFADGHVKWLKPDDVSHIATSRNQSVYTFSIR